MKKFLAFLLILCMLIPTFVACDVSETKDTESNTDTPTESLEPTETVETDAPTESESQTEPPVTDIAKLKVGFAKVDITPDYSVPLAGDSSRRMSEGVNDNIYATVIVFEDGDGNRALLMTADLLHLTDEDNVYTSLIRRLKKLGFDEGNVILSATHTHSAPEIYRGWLSTTYNVELYKKVLEAAEAAVADLSETDIYIGTKDVANMTFTRRYYDANGDFVGVNWPNNNQPVAHESEADGEMVATKFVREGKKDIVLVNWGAHPTGMSGAKNKYISADYIGFMREYAEDKLKCDFAFFQAASGNTVTDSKIPELKNGYDTENYGKQLGMQLGLVLKKMTQINSNVSLKTNMEMLTIYKNNSPENKPENVDVLIKIATEFLEGKINSSEALTRSREAGVSSVYEAMKYRSLYGINKDVTESSLRFVTINVGGLTFASAPFEMFCENGKSIKERSEAELTFIVTHANGGYGYIPTAEAIEKGGYEVATFTYMPDTAQRIEDKIVELVNKHYN